MTDFKMVLRTELTGSSSNGRNSLSVTFKLSDDREFGTNSSELSSSPGNWLDVEAFRGR